MENKWQGYYEEKQRIEDIFVLSRLVQLETNIMGLNTLVWRRENFLENANRSSFFSLK